MQKIILTESDIVLRLSYIGYRGKFNLRDTISWLWESFGIQIVMRNNGEFYGYNLYFKSHLLLIIQFGNNEEESEIFRVIMGIILKLWKCENGILSGPSIDNFEDPDIEWT